MKIPKMKIVGFGSLLLATYFAAYFLSVRYFYASFSEAEAEDVFVTADYQPCDTSFVHLAFAPAHYLDARYFRPKSWMPKRIEMLR